MTLEQIRAHVENVKRRSRELEVAAAGADWPKLETQAWRDEQNRRIAEMMAAIRRKEAE